MINQCVRKFSPHDKGLSVLDLCCGRGGDLGKWAKQKINHYVGLDLSEQLIIEAKARFEETQAK